MAAADTAILMVLVTHSAMPALIIFRMGFDRQTGLNKHLV
jgi:hypothetical protein